MDSCNLFILKFAYILHYCSSVSNQGHKSCIYTGCRIQCICLDKVHNSFHANNTLIGIRCKPSLMCHSDNSFFHNWSIYLDRPWINRSPLSITCNGSYHYCKSRIHSHYYNTVSKAQLQPSSKELRQLCQISFCQRNQPYLFCIFFSSEFFFFLCL